MENLIKADIFFVITSVSVIIFTIGLIIILFYVIRILKNADHISTRVKEESDNVIEDIGILRREVKEEGFKIMPVFRFLKKLFDRRSTRK